MSFFSNLALASAIVAVASVAPVRAQSPLVMSDAELAVPFGATKGKIALVGSQIVFIATEDSAASMSIDRSDITGADRSGDVVTITTRRTLRAAGGESNSWRFRLSEPGDLMKWYESLPMTASTAAVAAVPPGVLASYQAKHDHRLGSCQGTLVLTADRVAFESADEINDSRQWLLVDIKKVEQNGVYKLKVEPFQGDTFNLELMGKGMDSGQFRRLVDRIARARTSR